MVKRSKKKRSATYTQAERDVQNDLIVEALARGLNNERAAEFAGITSRTFYNRTRDGALRGRVEEKRREIAGEMTGKLLDRLDSMLNVLCNIAEDENAVIPARVQAASKVFDLAIKFGEHSELRDKVADLTKRMLAQKVAQRPGVNCRLGNAQW